MECLSSHGFTVARRGHGASCRGVTRMEIADRRRSGFRGGIGRTERTCDEDPICRGFVPRCAHRSDGSARALAVVKLTGGDERDVGGQIVLGARSTAFVRARNLWLGERLVGENRGAPGCAKAGAPRRFSAGIPGSERAHRRRLRGGAATVRRLAARARSAARALFARIDRPSPCRSDRRRVSDLQNPRDVALERLRGRPRRRSVFVSRTPRR
jgi:hypothetical protein